MSVSLGTVTCVARIGVISHYLVVLCACNVAVFERLILMETEIVGLVRTETLKVGGCSSYIHCNAGFNRLLLHSA